MSADGSLADAFAEMPLTLKGVTSFFAVFGGGSVLLALLPGLEHRVGDATFDAAGLWRSGFGPFALGMGLWLSLSAFGLLRRTGWACWGVIGAWALFVVAEATLATTPRLGWQVGLAFVWGSSAWAYLYRTRGAAAFFKREVPR